MTTKTVLVTISTKPQVFPLGTVEGLYHFQIARASDGFVLSFVDTNAPGASFPLVPDGDYIALVSKQGVTATANFSIAKSEETIQVPDVVLVTIS